MKLALVPAGIVLLLSLAWGLAASSEGPRGHLLIVGGGGTTDDMLARALRDHGGSKAKVVVFPQASSVADAGGGSATMWKDAGAAEAVVADPKQEEQALRLVEAADVIWFPGGVQSRLMQALQGTRLPEAIRRRYREGALVGGTSAGAAVMSRVMITGDIEGDTKEDSGLAFVRSRTVKTEEGLGLFPEAIVDQHFVRRQRFQRLLSCVLDNPGLVGVGIDERTAILVQGTRFEVLGESNVLVVDARVALSEEERPGKPPAASGLGLAVLRHGSVYDLARPSTR